MGILLWRAPLCSAATHVGEELESGGRRGLKAEGIEHLDHGITPESDQWVFLPVGVVQMPGKLYGGLRWSGPSGEVQSDGLRLPQLGGGQGEG